MSTMNLILSHVTKGLPGVTAKEAVSDWLCYCKLQPILYMVSRTCTDSLSLVVCLAMALKITPCAHCLW